LSEFIHQPVLLDKCLEGLNIKQNGIYVDGTLGGGGHSAAIVQRLGSNGLLIGIDRDGDAISAGERRLKSESPKIGSSFILIRDKHENVKQILDNLSIPLVDGFLLDLGVSSYQLDTPERGFSYRYDAPLDMRMDDRSTVSAYDVVNGYLEGDLIKIISNYGEERYVKRIVRAICKNRPIKTTLQLTQIIANAVPGGHINPGSAAMRTFQAIRIAVNEELIDLAQTIDDMTTLLKPKGRICIITFHSLEDRIVKRSFKQKADPCECSRKLPYCVCRKKPTLSIITKKPLTSDPEELALNPRAHSAKLRIAERLGEQI